MESYKIGILKFNVGLTNVLNKLQTGQFSNVNNSQESGSKTTENIYFTMTLVWDEF